MSVTPEQRQRIASAVLAVLLCGLLYGAGAPERAVGGPATEVSIPAADQPGDVLIQPGRREGRVALGFGWGRSEMTEGRRFAWIQRYEADVHVKTEGAPAAAEFWLVAKPLWLGYRRQVVALYANGRYVTEWVCPDGPEFATYRTVIPARFLRPDENTLTLRMAYRKSGGDRRKLALGVEAILLRKS